MKKYTIIDSGMAGISVVEAIRSVDGSGEITLIGDDPYGHYSRPGLAYYLTGEIHVAPNANIAEILVGFWTTSVKSVL